MAQAWQEFDSRPAALPRAPQFKLRRLLLFVTLFALALAILSRVPLDVAPMFGTPLLILACLLSIEPRATGGAVLGFVLCMTVASSCPEHLDSALLLANWGALLGATLHAVWVGRVRVGCCALCVGLLSWLVFVFAGDPLMPTLR